MRAPLLDRARDAVLFERPGGAVRVSQFLADVGATAAGLPEGRYLINLCRDRYAFAVGFCAGLVAGRTALLNVEAGGIGALPYPGCTVVADEAVATDLPVTLVAEGAAGKAGAVPEIECEALAAIVFTSGSTGVPVAHPKRWGALVARSRAGAAAFDLAGGTVVGTVPPQHMYGFETTVLLPLHADVASWCGPGFFPGDVAAAVLACPAPRVLVTTPLQMRALLGAGIRMRVAGVISATAPLEGALAERAEAAWEGPVWEIFGATECGSIAWRRTVAGQVWAVYPGVEVRVGEATAVRAPFADEVVLADVVEAAPGGFRLVGRRTDVVKLGGRRASLAGLNGVLTGLPGVVDGAFVAPEDLEVRSTARLVAVAVAPGRTGAAILAELRRVLDPVFLPRRVILVDQLPRNELGKLPRAAMLRLIEEAGVGSRAGLG